MQTWVWGEEMTGTEIQRDEEVGRECTPGGRDEEMVETHLAQVQRVGTVGQGCRWD